MPRLSVYGPLEGMADAGYLELISRELSLKSTRLSAKTATPTSLWCETREALLVPAGDSVTVQHPGNVMGPIHSGLVCRYWSGYRSLRSIRNQGNKHCARLLRMLRHDND